GQSISIFVSTSGRDSNPGTMGMPKASVAAGLAAAANDSTKKWVLVGTGVYHESIDLVNGIHVVGGYSFDWKRENRQRSTMRGGNPTVSGQGMEQPTMLANLFVEPTELVQDGESVVTVHLVNSPGVTLRNLKITGGRAGQAPWALQTN